MNMRFQGRVALVTGAGRGMGAATAHRLAQEGAKVIVNDRDADVAEQVAMAIRDAGGEAFAIQADVGVRDQVKMMVDKAVAHFGALHLAVNNAGIGGSPALLVDQPDSEWERVIAVNLSSVFYCMKNEIPAILASGGGAIVNVSSIFGSRGLAHYSHYTAAKHGVIGLTRAAGLEYATKGLRVNALCPGMYDTPMGNSGGEHSDAIAAMIPLKRLGRPEEAAAVTCFLLSDDAAFVNASDYAADAGMFH
jgi:NAD(P)-dependent dehydrogenase (short-subunit alcohol dehydrogenase family)